MLEPRNPAAPDGEWGYADNVVVEINILRIAAHANRRVDITILNESAALK